MNPLAIMRNRLASWARINSLIFSIRLSAGESVTSARSRGVNVRSQL